MATKRTTKKPAAAAPVSAPAKSKPKAKAPKPEPQVFKLHISLRDMPKPVFRELLAPSDMTFEDLHMALQLCMGWENEHLHAFIVGQEQIGPPDSDAPAELVDERHATLGERLSAGMRFVYEYDFGDGWQHDVNVEFVEPLREEFTYPLCVGGGGACPPEDCGGPPGYGLLLAALKRPNAESSWDLISSVGGYFDPKGFDANMVNREFRRG